MTPTFDYIIVGAGSAGCVLAKRLSEDGAATVAVVEAGGPADRKEIHIPAAFSKLFGSECDWAYRTEPQQHLNGRKLYWPRGKVVGGSSSINAMIYTRGHRNDFDGWSRAGCEGWSYADALRVFTRIERRGNDSGGILDVCDLRSTNPLSHAFVDACVENGIARNPDFNGDSIEGAGFFQVTQRNGKRHSCAAAYLQPALQRQNVTLFTHALTTRVIVEGGAAAGIEYVHNGSTNQLHARREVILSGGAVNSPQLLMLSGIGPAADLERLGIEVTADLPGVGRNLQDHITAGAIHHCTQPVSLAGAESFRSILRYLVRGDGMLASNIAEAGAFVTTNGSPTPDIELIFAPSFFMNHGKGNPKGHGFTVGAVLLHPKSRGSIRLRSADPQQSPSIQPQYLSEPEDLRSLVSATRLCRRVARAKAFDGYRGEEVWPGSQNESDDEIAAFIRNHTETLYHPVGTCRMGNDDESVVDSRLRVRGVESLRVIDASVMPSIITGHPNAAVVMIAERGAELITAD
jgi:choline dehydrogenase